MNIQAVIFDLDGTLVDSLKDLAVSVNYGLERLGLPAHPVEAYKQKVGNGVYKLIARSLPEDRQDLADELLDLQQGYYREHLAVYSKPYPGIVELVGQLKQRDLKLAVLSNKPDYLTQDVVERLLGADRFDAVWGHLEEYPHKPDPASALAIADQLGVAPSRTIFVGDTPIDLQTARSAEMVSIGVTWGFRSRDELIQVGGQILIDRPEDLLHYL